MDHIRAGRRIIQAIRQYGEGLTASQLAEAMRLTRQAVHQQLLQAEALGFVIRTTPPYDPDHYKPADQWWLADKLKLPQP